MNKSIILTIFVVALLLYNCQKESETIQEETALVQKEALFSSRMVHRSEMESNRVLSDKLRRLQQMNAENTQSFTVDTETAKYVEKADGSVYSYTFTVSRDQSPNSHVENLVISVNNQTQEVNSYLVKYLFSESQYQEAVTTSGHISTSFDTEIIELDEDFSDLLPEVDATYPCILSSTTYHITPNDGTYEYAANSQCQHIDPDTGETECEVYSNWTVYCPPSSGSSGSSSGPNNPSGPSSDTDPFDPNNVTNGGGSNTNTNTQNNNNDTPPHNEIVTTPMIRVSADEVATQLNATLDTGDSWSFGNNTNDENTLSFDSVDELEMFLNEMSNSLEFESGEVVENPLQGNTIIKFQAKFDLLIPLYINVHVKSVLYSPISNIPFEMIDVTSHESGIGGAILIEWEQESYSHFEGVSNITVRVNGHFNIGLDFLGFDITYKDKYILTAVFDKITGQVVSFTGEATN